VAGAGAAVVAAGAPQEVRIMVSTIMIDTT